ncbi:MAG: hypothetical protein EON55_10180, partial [Alphaproteobacteria bacterium]
MRISVPTIIAAVLVSAAGHAQPTTPFVNPGTPEPDCTMHVNYDRNADLPGYRLGASCIPFTRTYQLIPAGQGREFYTAGFSDAALRKRWETCRQDTACHAAALTGAKPFIAYEPRLTGTVDAFGRIDPEGDIDLKSIRRPGYFGAPRYAEPVAQAEGRTYTVEFTVPRDSYERRHLGRTGTIKLRGWYLEGAGIIDGDGPKRRALVI